MRPKQKPSVFRRLVDLGNLEGAMKLVECSRCGSNELFTEDGHAICAFCRSRFTPPANEHSHKETVVDVLSDIQVLFQKCEADPANSFRYANLILDIDPTNQAVAKYLR